MRSLLSTNLIPVRGLKRKTLEFLDERDRFLDTFHLPNPRKGTETLILIPLPIPHAQNQWYNT